MPDLSLLSPSQGAFRTESGATFSDDGLYRLRLWRHWDFERVPMTFIMLNPSTADASIDDPTIRRCMGFARREGCGGIIVVNLFGLRCTRPVHLFDGTLPDANGENNVMAVQGAVFEAAAARHYFPVVCAWGAFKRAGESEAFQWLKGSSADLLCLGTTADGSPKHPLYLKGDAKLIGWPA